MKNNFQSSLKQNAQQYVPDAMQVEMVTEDYHLIQTTCVSTFVQVMDIVEMEQIMVAVITENLALTALAVNQVIYLYCYRKRVRLCYKLS